MNMQILFTEALYAEVVYIVRYEVLFKVLSISKCKIKIKKSSVMKMLIGQKKVPETLNRYSDV